MPTHHAQPLLALCHVDNASSACVSDRRKVLGDHEQHEVHRLSKQQSSGTPRSKRDRNSEAVASLAQTLCSFAAVALIFGAFLYWAIVLLMPSDD